MRNKQENGSLPGILGNLGANSDFTEPGKGANLCSLDAKGKVDSSQTLGGGDT